VKGSVYRRCACRDETGKMRGPSCPRLGRERGHGTWYFHADVGRDGRTGKRREKRKGGFPTKAEAERALAEVLADVGRGEHRYDGRQTVSDWLTQWLADKIADEALRPTTRLTYTRYVEMELIQHLGRFRLGELRPAHVDRMLRDLRGAGRGNATIRQIHAVLRSALTSARRAGLIASNPASDVSLGGPRPGRVRPWEPAELGAFLDHAASHRLGTLFEVLAMTGLRRGEALGLHWADVNLDEGYLVVRRQLVEVGGHAQEGTPKTRAGEDRRVGLSQHVVGTLLAHRLSQDGERTAWGPGYADEDRVFCREDGRAHSPGQVTKVFARLATSAGLRPIRLHDLRHGAASLMLAGGTDLTVVSKHLGHSSIRVTADIYTHLLAGVGRTAAEAAQALVPRGAAPAAITLRSLGRENDEATPPQGGEAAGDDGAACRNRTDDLLITSEMLYRLS
jgi:integrase